MLYLTNTFTINMLPLKGGVAKIYYKELSFDEARKIYNRIKNMGEEIVSAIGHESTAKLVSMILGDEVKANRIMLKLPVGESRLLVFILKKRLPEGYVVRDLEELKELITVVYVNVVLEEI